MTRRDGKVFGRVPTHRVLVTGCPRGGTTFVGTALALPAATDYIHEPLNPACGLAEVETPFVDLGQRAHAHAAHQMRRLLAYRPELRGANYPRDSRAHRQRLRA